MNLDDLRHAYTNDELEDLARRARIHGFLGICRRNRLPTLKTGESVILNIGPMAGNGTHWVTVKRLGNVLYYISSMGEITPIKEVTAYAKKHKMLLETLPVRIQHAASHICGLYSLLFTVPDSPAGMMSLALTFDPFKNFAENDARAISLVKMLVH